VQDIPDWEATLFYGIVPAITYFLLACATASIWIAPISAALFIGAVMLFLLLIGIRNAWDLATFLVTRNQDQPSLRDRTTGSDGIALPSCGAGASMRRSMYWTASLELVTTSKPVVSATAETSGSELERLQQPSTM
jgi:uncharacterized oligopeptide transporter (OPT) family protein